ncbi:MAG TPA: YciI family protein [Pyrinomonadaceae bacterium]|nr:YciI family protein [Pyrinomonadaceae bacterium]
MVNKLLLIFIITCSLAATPLIVSQQKEEPKSKLVQFHMALIKKGPKWGETAEPQRNQILQQHFANVISMLGTGKAVIAGPMGDDTGLAGIFILRSKTAEEAKAWVDADPAVDAGLFTAEMHPWWSEDIFKKANAPLKFDTLYLAFLKKGPNRKEGDGETPEVQELQRAHIANIERLAAMKKLIAAGPFGDDGALRGIFVFRVGSLQEAQKLCATDPMIKIGRLTVELHPWQVPEGVLP